jgi:hypothetical protein
MDRVLWRPGCRLHGEYRAPFARDKLEQYRWFCLEHVRDYNKKWDYFRRPRRRPDRAAHPCRHDLAPPGLAARRPAQRRGRRSTTRSISPPNQGLVRAAGRQLDGSEQLTPAERNAMGVLELSWPLTRLT